MWLAGDKEGVEVTPAERQKLYRERQARGLRVLKGSLPIDEDSLTRLAEAGVIPAVDLDDDAEVLSIVSGLIDLMAEERVTAMLQRIMQRMADENFGPCYGVTLDCDNSSVDCLTEKDLY